MSAKELIKDHLDKLAETLLEIKDSLGIPLYEGKSKCLYATNDPNVYRMVFKDDITSGDGEKKETLLNKGSLNQTTSKRIYEYLHSCPTGLAEGRSSGRYDTEIATHYISSPFINEQLVKKLDIIPVEVIIRNFAAGSFCKRYGIKKGHKFNTPLLELFYKDDDLNDPLCGENVVTEMGWCNPSQLAEIKRQAYILNHHMQEFWSNKGLVLVDQKFEFGIDSEGNIMLADEITCDSQRLWDKDGKSLDKDIFRQGDSMNQVSDVYKYIHNLIGADSVNVTRTLKE